MLASGAGILKSSKHQAAGQQFLSWLASADGSGSVGGHPVWGILYGEKT